MTTKADSPQISSGTLRRKLVENLTLMIRSEPSLEEGEEEEEEGEEEEEEEEELEEGGEGEGRLADEEAQEAEAGAGAGVEKMRQVAAERVDLKSISLCRYGLDEPSMRR